jgi:hypothetical protein
MVRTYERGQSAVMRQTVQGYLQSSNSHFSTTKFGRSVPYSPSNKLHHRSLAQTNFLSFVAKGEKHAVQMKEATSTHGRVSVRTLSKSRRSGKTPRLFSGTTRLAH